MRSTVLVTAVLACLAFVVYATSSPVPALSIPRVGSVAHDLTESSGRPRETSSHSTAVAEALCIGEIPDKTKELATLIK